MGDSSKTPMELCLEDCVFPSLKKINDVALSRKRFRAGSEEFKKSFAQILKGSDHLNKNFVENPTKKQDRLDPLIEDAIVRFLDLSTKAKYNNVAVNHNAIEKTGAQHGPKTRRNISRRDKTSFLLKTLSKLKESKKDVYGALDAWVAWEEKFPISSIRQTLIMLEKRDEWHRVVQVIKWMLSKGQGTTMGTYEQLIRALDKDERAKEAHIFWKNRIGHDLHSVPWQLCELMISIYYGNNMLEHGVKLFKDLEAFGRKPPNKL